MATSASDQKRSRSGYTIGLMRGAAALAQARALHALLMLPLTACAAAVDHTAVDDAQLAARVKTALVNDPVIGAFTIEVRVVRGVASLSGRVRSEADVARVIDVARRVAGVTDVRPNLQTGAVQLPASPAAQEGRAPPAPDDRPEIDSPPGLLAVGASVGWSVPTSASFSNRVSFGPLIKLGSSAGFGPAIGFDWYQAELTTDAAAEARVRVKPIMGGVGYTWRLDRLAVSSSIVGGYAFNSLVIQGSGSAAGVPIGVGNSFAWRVGASVWYDVTRRVAMNISGGRVMTSLRMTVLEDERLDHRNTSGNTTILRAGLAYRIF